MITTINTVDIGSPCERQAEVAEQRAQVAVREAERERAEDADETESPGSRTTGP